MSGTIANLKIETHLYSLLNNYTVLPTHTTPQNTVSAFSAKNQGT